MGPEWLIFVRMQGNHPERTVVFRGTEPAELDLIEGRLEVEGLRPLRLGRAHAALVGGGNSAFQQIITVPNDLVPAAMAVLQAAEPSLEDGELERQALSADPAEPPLSTPKKKRGLGALPLLGPLLQPAR